MDIEGQFGFYTEDEKRVIDRGENVRLAYLDIADLYSRFEERRMQLDDLRIPSDDLTPEVNEQILYQGDQLRKDKLIIDGVAEQVLNWQSNQTSSISHSDLSD